MSPKKILIVEDNGVQLLAITEALVHAGYSVLQAATGHEGFQMAMSHEPALIVVDKLMPGLTGIEMMKKIREKKWGATVPVIFFSNSPAADDKEAIDMIKPLAYFVKSDASLKDIIEKIKTTLQEKPA